MSNYVGTIKSQNFQCGIQEMRWRRKIEAVRWKLCSFESELVNISVNMLCILPLKRNTRFLAIAAERPRNNGQSRNNEPPSLSIQFPLRRTRIHRRNGYFRQGTGMYKIIWCGTSCQNIKRGSYQGYVVNTAHEQPEQAPTGHGSKRVIISESDDYWNVTFFDPPLYNAN